MKELNSTHSDNGFAEAEGTPAAVLGLILRLVVAQCVVFEDHPTVLPSMDVICPLREKEKKNTSINIFECSVTHF